MRRVARAAAAILLAALAACSGGGEPSGKDIGGALALMAKPMIGDSPKAVADFKARAWRGQGRLLQEGRPRRPPMLVDPRPPAAGRDGWSTTAGSGSSSPSGKAEMATTAPRSSANPLAGLYEFTRAHLLVANNNQSDSFC